MVVCEMDMDLIFNGLKVVEGITFPNRKKLNNSDIKSLKGFTVLQLVFIIPLKDQIYCSFILTVTFVFIPLISKDESYIVFGFKGG